MQYTPHFQNPILLEPESQDDITASALLLMHLLSHCGNTLWKYEENVMMNVQILTRRSMRRSAKCLGLNFESAWGTQVAELIQ